MSISLPLRNGVIRILAGLDVVDGLIVFGIEEQSPDRELFCRSPAWPAGDVHLTSPRMPAFIIPSEEFMLLEMDFHASDFHSLPAPVMALTCRTLILSDTAGRKDGG
jgi:hypothetical protein